MENVIVRMIELPLTVHAFTLPDEQGDYNIYINSLLSAEQQKKSLLHEYKHIENGDFFRDDTVSVIEQGI